MQTNGRLKSAIVDDAYARLNRHETPTGDPHTDALLAALDRLIIVNHVSALETQEVLKAAFLEDGRHTRKAIHDEGRETRAALHNESQETRRQIVENCGAGGMSRRERVALGGAGAVGGGGIVVAVVEALRALGVS